MQTGGSGGSHRREGFDNKAGSERLKNKLFHGQTHCQIIQKVEKSVSQAAGKIAKTTRRGC
jgi:hypothetical protein